MFSLPHASSPPRPTPAPSLEPAFTHAPATPPAERIFPTASPPARPRRHALTTPPPSAPAAPLTPMPTARTAHVSPIGNAAWSTHARLINEMPTARADFGSRIGEGQPRAKRGRGLRVITPPMTPTPGGDFIGGVEMEMGMGMEVDEPPAVVEEVERAAKRRRGHGWSSDERREESGDADAGKWWRVYAFGEEGFEGGWAGGGQMDLTVENQRGWEGSGGVSPRSF